MNAATAPQKNLANGKGSTPEPPTLTTVREIPVSLIDESKTNPRRTFTKLEELAADVKVHGILQNLLVRPKGKRYEVVFGARRYRAAKLAKLETLPCGVRELDDAKTLELQLVENCQREDVHPLEEADGYQVLHKTHGYAVEEIAAKVNKPVSTVYARLKLATLIPKAREAFFAGDLSPATALLVARIPHAELQEKALSELTQKTWNGALPSLADAKHIIREKFTLRIVDAPFDRTDATLVAGAPACGGCPKRTGHQKELFADLETKDDLCTDPKCFAAKRDADAERKIAAAKEKGQEVLLGKKAKDLFSYGHLKHDSGFIDLSAETYVGDKKTTNAALLKKAGVEATVVLAKDPDGKLRELVDAKAFAKATKRPAPKPSKQDLKLQAERDAERKKHEKEKAKQAARVGAIVALAERRQPTDAFWRALARGVLSAAVEANLEDILLARGLINDADRKKLDDGGSVDTEAVAKQVIAKLTGAQARGLVVELCIRAQYRVEEDVILDFEHLYGLDKRVVKKKAAAAKKKR